MCARRLWCSPPPVKCTLPICVREGREDSGGCGTHLQVLRGSYRKFREQQHWKEFRAAMMRGINKSRWPIPAERIRQLPGGDTVVVDTVEMAAKKKRRQQKELKLQRQQSLRRMGSRHTLTDLD